MSRNHSNSKRRPELLWKRKEELEKKLRQLDLAPVLPDLAPEPSRSTPMLGHTKGNTKSNRKKIKSTQVHMLEQIVKALEGQLREALEGKEDLDEDESSEYFISQSDEESNQSLWHKSALRPIQFTLEALCGLGPIRQLRAQRHDLSLVEETEEGSWEPRAWRRRLQDRNHGRERLKRYVKR
jgi:hypothetical protein